MNNAYIIFERVSVQDANCIAGFTYGFPAITHFLGFGHALSKKLSLSHNLSLYGCAVICHQHQIHAYQPTFRTPIIENLNISKHTFGQAT
jgi:CRISPR-associated protein Csy2